MRGMMKAFLSVITIFVFCSKVNGKPSKIDNVYEELDELKDKLGALKTSFDELDGDGFTEIDKKQQDELAEELPKEDKDWLDIIEEESFPSDEEGEVVFKEEGEDGEEQDGEEEKGKGGKGKGGNGKGMKGKGGMGKGGKGKGGKEKGKRCKEEEGEDEDEEKGKENGKGMKGKGGMGKGGKGNGGKGKGKRCKEEGREMEDGAGEKRIGKGEKGEGMKGKGGMGKGVKGQGGKGKGKRCREEEGDDNDGEEEKGKGENGKGMKGKGGMGKGGKGKGGKGKCKEEGEGGVFETIEKINAQSNNDELHGVDIMHVDDDDWETDDTLTKRNAIFNRDKLWKTRDVPYVIHPTSINDTAVIMMAMAEISDKTCIKFHVKKSSDPDWLEIFRGSGCWSYVGRVISGRQKLSIGQGCAYKGIIMHELLHALGFFHEQSRHDRDNFVEVLWQNIIPGMEGNFRKLTQQNSLNLQSPYDLDGIMHYSPYSFSKNGKPTIKSLTNGTAFGQRNGLSDEDINGVIRLYGCLDIINGWTSWSHYTPCDVNCMKSRSRFCGSSNSSKCIGNLVEKTTCTVDECKTDGNWGRWLGFGSCSVTARCTLGTKIRRRECDNPPATGLGLPCPGNATELKICKGACPSNCTFDEDFCGWAASGLWRRRSGTTPSYQTGPDDDITGGGSYAYTEVSSQKPGVVSLLGSPYFSKKGPVCFQFNYHMYGVDMGNLSLYVETDQGGNTSRNLKWNKYGDQGNQWKEVRVDVGSVGIDGFTIEFEGICGSSYRGDSAIDNLILFDAPCGGEVAPTPTTGSPTAPHVTTKTSKASPVTTEPATGPPIIDNSTAAPIIITGSPIAPNVTTKTPTAPPVTAEPVTGPPIISTEAPVIVATTEEPDITTAGDAVKFTCNFDRGAKKLCGMKPGISNSTSDDLDWKVGNKPTNILERYKRTRTGPSGDRVMERGSFLYVSSYADGDQVEGRKAIINSPKFNGSGIPQAIEFYYHMYNNDNQRRQVDGMGSLAVNIIDETDGLMSTLHMFNGSAGKFWKGATFNFEVDSQNIFYIQFVATVGKENRSDIAIDDIAILPNVDLFPEVASPTTASCSFQHNFCSYSLGGDFKWRRQRGSTPTFNTGPKMAATQNYHDFYAYIESSLPRRLGDVASMKSPLLYTSNPMCMHIFVNMNGKDIGSLEGEFLQFSENGTQTPSLSYYASESRGKDWWEERIQLPTDVKFKIEINATVGDGPRGDIAIDNILVKPGFCRIFDYIEHVVCDFDTNCSMKGEHEVVSENVAGILNKFVRAKALWLIIPKVPQRGACLSFQYRLNDNSRYSLARILVYVYYSQIGRKGYSYYDTRKLRMISHIYDRAEKVFITHKISLPPGPGVRKNYEVLIKRMQSKRSKGTFDLDNVTITEGFCAPQSAGVW